VNSQPGHQSKGEVLPKNCRKLSHIGMIKMLESRGMVSYLAKVSFRMDEDEVALALWDKAMRAVICRT